MSDLPAIVPAVFAYATDQLELGERPAVSEEWA